MHTYYQYLFVSVHNQYYTLYSMIEHLVYDIDIGGVKKHLVKNKNDKMNSNKYVIYCAYLLTALFASVSACCANSPGNIN